MKFMIVVATIAIMLSSWTFENDRFAVIKGRFLDDSKGKEIHLSKVEHGTRVKVATTIIGEDGYFGFNVGVDKPGIYVINAVNSEQQRNGHKDHNLKRFYLEPGTEFEIEMTEGNYKLIKTNSSKNELLSAWNTQVDSMFTYSHGSMYSLTSYKDFFPLLPDFVKQGEDFKKDISTEDVSFNELMKLLVDTDIAASALRMVQIPRGIRPTPQDFPDFYQVVLNERKPESERLLELPEGIRYVNAYVMYYSKQLAEKQNTEDYLIVGLNSIPNDLLKGYFVVSNLRRFRAYDASYLDFKEKTAAYIKTDYQKEEVRAFELTIRSSDAGAHAVDFAGKDINGKEIKLSDFKGNVVYVDVWATWCGPCKAEIPALKELEKKFHGQAITFMSVSLDKPKDKQKWLDFVKNENLTGVQLIADKAFDSDIVKSYNIMSIPRFMVFDKEGNIVNINASRPSNEKTEAFLRSLL